MFHHRQEAIEAHLTVVFAALAIARDLQERSGVSIKKLVQTLHAARSATIEINGQHLTIDPDLSSSPNHPGTTHKWSLRPVSRFRPGLAGSGFKDTR